MVGIINSKRLFLTQQLLREPYVSEKTARELVDQAAGLELESFSIDCFDVVSEDAEVVTEGVSRLKQIVDKHHRVPHSSSRRSVDKRENQGEESPHQEVR